MIKVIIRDRIFRSMAKGAYELQANIVALSYRTSMMKESI